MAIKQFLFDDKVYNEDSDFVVNIEYDKSLKINLYDKIEKKFIGFEEIIIGNENIDLVNALNNSKLLNKVDAKSITIVSKNKYTFLPKEYFDLKNLHSFLNFNTDNTSSKIQFNYNPKFGFYTIFSIPEDEYFILIKKFPFAKFKHFSSILLEQGQNGFFVNFYCEDKFNIMYTKNYNLIFSNNFEFKNKEESYFYLQSVLDELNIDSQDLIIYLSGKIEEKSVLLNYWKQNLQKSKFFLQSIFEKNNFSSSLFKLSKQNYYIIFNSL